MNILTSLAQVLRQTSKPEGIFTVRPGYDSLRILQEAEQWSKDNGVGAWVVFMPGVHEIRYTFEFYWIAKILDHGIGSAKLRRYGQAWLYSVRDYAEINHAPEIGGFDIENMVETDEPAIELGGCQNAYVHDIYSWGKPADALCFTNTTPQDPPPAGRPFGTWTENITLERVVVYSPKSAAIRFRVSDPQKRGQSFSYLRLAAQITCTVPGSVAVDFESHCHAYGALIHLKANLDVWGRNAELPCAVNVGPECNITGVDFGASFVEGVPIYGPVEEGRPILRSAGYRIRVASSARVRGHGKFYRQRESHTPDDITPGVNWAGEPAGTIKGDILAEEGI